MEKLCQYEEHGNTTARKADKVPVRICKRSNDVPVNSGMDNLGQDITQSMCRKIIDDRNIPPHHRIDNTQIVPEFIEIFEVDLVVMQNLEIGHATVGQCDKTQECAGIKCVFRKSPR